MTMIDIKNTYGMTAELSKDLMLDKIFLSAIALFCISTELRFIRSKNNGALYHK